MNNDLDPAEVSGTSSAATERATGKPWAEWMEILDAAGGRKMDHKQLVAHLAEHYMVSPWWQQQLTVAYEKSRRLRDQHEMTDGYQISRSRTLAAGTERIYRAWIDDAERGLWLPGVRFSPRTTTPPRLLRLAWSDGSVVEVRLTEKGSDRTQVTVQQVKLADGSAAEQMKAYWAEALDRLSALVTRAA